MKRVGLLVVLEIALQAGCGLDAAVCPSRFEPRGGECFQLEACGERLVARAGVCETMTGCALGHPSVTRDVDCGGPRDAG